VGSPAVNLRWFRPTFDAECVTWLAAQRRLPDRFVREAEGVVTVIGWPRQDHLMTARAVCADRAHRAYAASGGLLRVPT